MTILLTFENDNDDKMFFACPVRSALHLMVICDFPEIVWNWANYVKAASTDALEPLLLALIKF